MGLLRFLKALMDLTGLNCLGFLYINSMNILMIAVSKMIIQVRSRVKLEFVQSSFNSIRKFEIGLIQKVKEYLKNSMKNNSNYICSIRLQR